MLEQSVQGVAAMLAGNNLVLELNQTRIIIHCRALVHRPKTHACISNCVRILQQVDIQFRARCAVCDHCVCKFYQRLDGPQRLEQACQQLSSSLIGQ